MSSASLTKARHPCSGSKSIRADLRHEPDPMQSDSRADAPATARSRASDAARHTSCQCLRAAERPAPPGSRLNTNGVVFAELKIRCCSMIQFDVRIGPSSSVPSDRKTTTLSMRFMNSGVNLRRAASTPAREIFAFSSSSRLAERGSPFHIGSGESQIGSQNGTHFRSRRDCWS